MYFLLLLIRSFLCNACNLAAIVVCVTLILYALNCGLIKILTWGLLYGYQDSTLHGLVLDLYVITSFIPIYFNNINALVMGLSKYEILLLILCTCLCKLSERLFRQ